MKCAINETIFVRYLSQPGRAVWIEMYQVKEDNALQESQPGRAVWIEICIVPPTPAFRSVTAWEGCVD